MASETESQETCEWLLFPSLFSLSEEHPCVYYSFLSSLALTIHWLASQRKHNFPASNQATLFVFMCTFVCTWKPRTVSVIVLLCHLPMLWRQDLSPVWNSLSGFIWLASKLQGVPCLCLTQLRLCSCYFKYGF